MSCKIEKIQVTVGDKIFHADFYKNDVSKEILSKLPLTVRMDKENSSFFVPLSKKVNGRADSISQVVNGDITICNSISVAIFTESQNVGPNFISIGHINNPENLSQVLSASNGLVTFDVAGSDLAATA